MEHTENGAQTPHKRRVRYKGKYPKKFEEKYKELQPEKYQDTVEHVIRKGNTPAGMHISIMVKEILDFLEIKPGQVGFDATLGYGGHTKAMLQCLQGEGHMYATDVDPEESAKTRKRLAERLDTISVEELAGMLDENSDEPYCEEIAEAIVKEIRRGNRIDTTTKLRQVIENTLEFLPEKERKDTVKKTCQRVFQALRIDVNREFEVLYEFMEKLPGALKPGGRVAILTFHSGEDRLVKKALKDGYKSGIYTDYAKDVIRPSAQECAQNGRARSTKMRWAIRSDLEV